MIFTLNFDNEIVILMKRHIQKPMSGKVVVNVFFPIRELHSFTCSLFKQLTLSIQSWNTDIILWNVINFSCMGQRKEKSLHNDLIKYWCSQKERTIKKSKITGSEISLQDNRNQPGANSPLTAALSASHIPNGIQTWPSCLEHLMTDQTKTSRITLKQRNLHYHNRKWGIHQVKSIVYPCNINQIFLLKTFRLAVKVSRMRVLEH